MQTANLRCVIIVINIYIIIIIIIIIIIMRGLHPKKRLFEVVTVYIFQVLRTSVKRSGSCGGRKLLCTFDLANGICTTAKALIQISLDG